MITVEETNKGFENKELSEFEKLMNEVAELPAEQQEKVTYFVQGVIAARRI